MKTLIQMTAALAIAAVAFAAPAAAQVDVELAFDPASASAGDQVTFFASVANLGDEAALADISLSVSFGAFEFGPIPGKLPLAAGEELSLEIPFVVPMLADGGTLTISATASIGEFSDSSTATLEIAAGGGESNGSAFGDLAGKIRQDLDRATPVEKESFGTLKSRN